MLNKKVIVVGGGLAGLSAAYELSQEDGVEVHLLERRNRLGGRVHALEIEGYMVDFGGFIIYPWYKRYHELIKELNIEGRLQHIPDLSVYLMDSQGILVSNESILPSFQEFIQVMYETFPRPLTDLDPSHPQLDDYHHMTIAEYLNSLDLPVEIRHKYLNAFDVFLQGYCYAPASEQKMALMGATIYNNLFFGDVHESFYFPEGNHLFVEALEKKLRDSGVIISLETEVKGVEGTVLETSAGRFDADAVIFCQTVDAELYERLLGKPVACDYTHFVTATVKAEQDISVKGDQNWGAVFLKDQPEESLSVLSAFPLEQLYARPELSSHLQLNIKCEGLSIPSDEVLLSVVKSRLEPLLEGLSVSAVVERVDWKKTMPVAQESFVSNIRDYQGRSGIYFAGDYMGCPSMETALMSGKRAAEMFLKIS